MTFDRDAGSLRVLLAPRLWLAGAMGFASGLPLLLTLTVLQAWLTEGGVDLTTIGFIGLVGLPYNLKFIWAPLLDRFKPLGLGRRRSWLMICSGVKENGVVGCIGAGPEWVLTSGPQSLRIGEDNRLLG